MRVVTDHQINVAISKQLRRDLALLVVQLARVLRAPVAADQYEIGAAILRLLRLAGDRLGIDLACTPGLTVRIRIQSA
jgi:hypothetical protein